MSALRISVPGRPIQLIEDFDPETRLSPRQRQVLTTLRGHNGDRRRAAKTLGITKEGLEGTIRRIRAAGVPVPPGKGTRLGIPNENPRPKRPRCGKPLQRRPGLCGLPDQHSGFCRSVQALAKDRAWRAGRMLRLRGRAA